jgi:hypothetical protein
MRKSPSRFKGTLLNKSFDQTPLIIEERLGEDGFERSCFLDGPTGKAGDTRSFNEATSARRKSRTTRDDEPDTFSLPDEEPEGWALP